MICFMSFQNETKLQKNENTKFLHARRSQGHVCLFVFVCFCGRPLLKELGIPIGILPKSGAGVDGNAPYQANPGIQTNFLPPRPVQS